MYTCMCTPWVRRRSSVSWCCAITFGKTRRIASSTPGRNVIWRAGTGRAWSTTLRRRPRSSKAYSPELLPALLTSLPRRGFSRKLGCQGTSVLGNSVSWSKGFSETQRTLGHEERGGLYTPLSRMGWVTANLDFGLNLNWDAERQLRHAYR